MTRMDYQAGGHVGVSSREWATDVTQPVFRYAGFDLVRRDMVVSGSTPGSVGD